MPTKGWGQHLNDVNTEGGLSKPDNGKEVVPGKAKEFINVTQVVPLRSARCKVLQNFLANGARCERVLF